MAVPEEMTYEQLFARTVVEAQRKGVRVADPAPPVNRTCRGISLLDWQGQDGLPPMLLLHGALLQAHVWDFFSLDLRAHFHVHSVDLPGHGDSDWHPDGDYSRGRVADQIAGLVEHLDLSSLVLIGHSFGGAVGAMVAERMPRRIRALGLVDSTLLPSGLPSIRAQMAARPHTFPSLEAFARHLGPEDTPEELERRAIRLRWSARRLADGNWTWKYDPALRQPAPFGPAGFEEVWSALERFAGPILFVRAGRHSHLSPEAAERLQALPNVRLTVVPESGHNVMSEQPIAFTQVVREFLS